MQNLLFIDHQDCVLLQSNTPDYIPGEQCIKGPQMCKNTLNPWKEDRSSEGMDPGCMGS